MHRFLAVVLLLAIPIVLATAIAAIEPQSVDLSNQSQPSPEDRLEPAYVGRKVCRECHQQNYELHAKHGHASTFHLVEETEIAAMFDRQSVDGGDQYGVYQYHKDNQGKLSVKLPKRFADQSLNLDYVLGSGMHAQTLLTLKPGLARRQRRNRAQDQRFSWRPFGDHAGTFSTRSGVGIGVLRRSGDREFAATMCLLSYDPRPSDRRRA